VQQISIGLCYSSEGEKIKAVYQVYRAAIANNDTLDTVSLSSNNAHNSTISIIMHGIWCRRGKKDENKNAPTLKG